ncbi:MAG: hypothetical protein QOE54_5652 [Streptosporangiaceae bacterium]|jgi:hypothetical protein|nr:hypothetical protein [Streptosporangiaceae bacterium]
MRALAWAPASLVVVALVVASWQAREPAGRHGPSALPSSAAEPRASYARPASVTELKAALLGSEDLPAGFIPRPLTGRNLPTHLTGCRPLQELMAGGIGPQAQVEFFRLPFGPWIDEAIMQPSHGSADQVNGRLAAALAGCDSVTVTEEGHRVRLALAAVRPPMPGAHAYQATGRLRGLWLRMGIVLVPAGRCVLLLANAALGEAADPALTDQVSATALRKAARA